MLGRTGLSYIALLGWYQSLEGAPLQHQFALFFSHHYFVLKELEKVAEGVSGQLSSQNQQQGYEILVLQCSPTKEALF